MHARLRRIAAAVFCAWNTLVIVPPVRDHTLDRVRMQENARCRGSMPASADAGFVTKITLIFPTQLRMIPTCDFLGRDFEDYPFRRA